MGPETIIKPGQFSMEIPGQIFRENRHAEIDASKSDRATYCAINSDQTFCVV